MGLHEQAYEATAQPDDEDVLIQGVLTFTLQPDLPDILEKLTGDDFHSATKGAIWDAAKRLHARGKYCTSTSLTAEVGGGETHKSIITKAKGVPVKLGEMRTAVELVEAAKHKRALLDLIAAAEQSITTGGDTGSYDSVFSQIQSGLMNLAQSDAKTDAARWETAVNEFWDEIDNPTRILTIPTPWDALNDYLNGGLKSGRLYTFAARPGDGKSLAILNIAGHAAEQGFNVGVFSLELNQHEVTARLLAAGARADYGQITRGEIDAHNRALMRDYEPQLESLTIVDRDNFNADELERQCRQMQRVHGLDLVVVDYLQIMKGDKRIQRHLQISENSGGLKAMSKRLGIPVVTAAQLNRDSKKEGKRPTKEDLRESGSIEQDSDCVIVLHHELFQGRKQTGEIELIVDKNRTGREGVVTEFYLPHRARIGT